MPQENVFRVRTNVSPFRTTVVTQGQGRMHVYETDAAGTPVFVDGKYVNPIVSKNAIMQFGIPRYWPE